MFSRFSKVAIGTSNFLNELYNGGFAQEFSVAILKEIIVLVRDYVSETRKSEEKPAENIYENEM